MWPFNRGEEGEGQVAVETPVETDTTSTPDIQCPPFGAQVAGLTQFGGTWINLNEVSVIEFDPPDGCGAECRFKGAKGKWHIPDADALALRTYLEAFDQLKGQVDAT